MNFRTLLTREVVKVFLKAVWRVAVYMWRNRTLDPRVKPSVLAKRLVACQLECDQYLADTKQCGVCKCFILAKARLVTEDCPHPDKNHWT